MKQVKHLLPNILDQMLKNIEKEPDPKLRQHRKSKLEQMKKEIYG